MNLAYATAPDRRKKGSSRQSWSLKNTNDHFTRLRTVWRFDCDLASCKRGSKRESWNQQFRVGLVVSRGYFGLGDSARYATQFALRRQSQVLSTVCWVSSCCARSAA